MLRLQTIAVILLFPGCNSQTDRPSVRQEQTKANRVNVVGPTMAISEWEVGNVVVWDLQFAPDGHQIAQCVAPNGERIKREIKILRIEDGTEVYRVDASFPTAICFSPNSQVIAVLGPSALSVHDLSAHQLVFSIDLQSYNSDIQALGFTDDGHSLIGAAEFLDPTTKQIAWDAKTGEVIPMPTRKVFWRGRGLSPDGTMFFDGGWPGPTPRIYKTDLSARITYCFRDKWPVDATFTPDSKNLVTLHEDGLLVLWEIKDTGENARQLLSYSGFDGYARFAISHDQQRIAAAKDGVVRVWNLPMIADSP